MRTIALALPAERFLADIQRCAADARVSGAANVPHPFPADGARQWLERAECAMRRGESLAFVVLLERAFAGLISLSAIDWGGACADLEFWIAGDCQGFGVGTEAVQLAVALARHELQLDFLFSSCVVSNRAADRVLRKSGFCEMEHFRCTGGRGAKFLHREMIRFRKRLRPEFIDCAAGGLRPQYDEEPEAAPPGQTAGGVGIEPARRPSRD